MPPADKTQSPFSIAAQFLTPTRQDVARAIISVVIFFGAFLVYHFQLLERFELVTYDYRVLIKGTRPADPRIVVVEISDDSVAKIGRWPWDRNWHATLVKVLTEAGARAVIFDVIFSEKSDPKMDTALSEAIQRSDRVFLAQVVQKHGDDIHLLKSLPEFSDPSRPSGHINLRPDIDGVMRRIPIVHEIGGQSIPQLSLAVYMDDYGLKPEDLLLTKDSLKLKPGRSAVLNIPLDHNGDFIINWTGRWKDTFTHVSFIDVITSYVQAKKGEKPALPMDLFKNKFCFVGTSAAGLYDIRPTPLEPSYPAVGVNLTVLNNLLEQRFIRNLSYGQNLVILVFLMFAMFPIMRAKSYFRSALATVLLIFGYILFSIAFFVFFGLWMNIIYPLVLMLGTYFFVTMYNQLSVTIERGRLLKLATRDSLTGLYNIGHFKLLLKAEITTIAIRREKKLSIIMGDVDDFKHINDTYGHITGDDVLKEVSNVIRSNCRALDVAARYGGEEFIVMLPGANSQEAFKVAEKVRTSVNSKVFFHEKGDFRTSISVGVTQVSPDDKDVDAVVARADRALYTAKKSGKNKVIMATDSPIINETINPQTPA